MLFIQADFLELESGNGDGSTQIKVFIAYEVTVTSHINGEWSLVHGSHITIARNARYYWYVAGKPCWDNLRMLKMVVVDWNRGELHCQLHFSDLKWFSPYYDFLNGRPVQPRISREELGQEIKRRVASAKLE